MNYLEQVNVPKAVIEAAVTDKVRGSYLVELFSDPSAVHQLLEEDLAFTNRK